MTGLLILAAVVLVPYVGFNVRRVRRGRRWAFTVCQVAKEWEKREYEKRLARRAAASTRSRDIAGQAARATRSRDIAGQAARATRSRDLAGQAARATRSRDLAGQAARGDGVG